MSRTATLLRFLACGLVAATVFILGGGWLVHHYLGNRPDQVLGVKVVRGINLITSIPGNEAAKENDSTNPSQRLVNGFVQVAFTVGKDGRAHDIHVVRAIPEGVYERAARTVIAARHFDPAKAGQGTTEQTEIVHFRIPADQLQQDGKQNGNPDDGS